ncbi:phospholipase A1-like [Leptopilina heterotoma]|uniref:phospholipase A1-like n=1 Tax=Leptopilina heterotoma TaxID=63436 RepID=UPI001CA80EF6|nr:phospholipase A1-like [Leptopilina heterotoma]XP_043464784.1 phospholipase A1-like [Leptopilina heterotoma]
MRTKLLVFLLVVCVLTAVVESRRYRYGRRNNRYRGRGLFWRLRHGWGWRFWRNPFAFRRKSIIPPTIIGVGTGGINKLQDINLLSGLNMSIINGMLSMDNIQSDGFIKFDPLTLTLFLTKQINFFKDKILFMYDDFEKPFKLKLELPDINLLNIRPNLDEKVTFALFDKTDGNNSFDVLKVDNEDVLSKSRFDKNRPTVFITHGFMASANGTSVTLVRDAYLNKQDYNVITVNWSPLSVGSYTIARLMVISVGNHLGKLINFLYKHGMNPNTTILVGHSLGSHVMGFAGQTATPNVNHTIGLDPAWPLFVGLTNNQRISNDDAHNVEIIHTNGGLLGTPTVTGDYDFYPNGGSFQNGCSGEYFTACSHGRSYKYLSEQIQGEGKNFLAVQCDSYKKFKKGECSNNTNTAIMGALDIMNNQRGSYYLNTNDKSPFGLGFLLRG